MLPPLLARSSAISRDKLMWSLLAVLVAGQLLAFWMLCSHQVRRAEVRDATLQVQRVAVADCLRYIPKATLNSCASRVDPNGRPDGSVVLAADKPGQANSARSTMTSAMPVSFSYR
jgi:hypothetical protein